MRYLFLIEDFDCVDIGWIMDWVASFVEVGCCDIKKVLILCGCMIVSFFYELSICCVVC